MKINWKVFELFLNLFWINTSIQKWLCLEKLLLYQLQSSPTTIVISYGWLNVGVLEHVTESNSKSSQKFFWLFFLFYSVTIQTKHWQEVIIFMGGFGLYEVVELLALLHFSNHPVIKSQDESPFLLGLI